MLQSVLGNPPFMPRKSNPHPRTKPPEQRRADLMDAASHLFLSRGIAATSVEQITERAAVAKGTFYLYFSSKEDVLAALAERYGDELLEPIKAAVAARRGDDWKGKLAAWVTATVNAYLDSIQLHDILFHGALPKKREGVSDNVIVEYLSELLQAGAESGGWSLEDPHSAAVFLFSGLHGMVDDSHAREKRIQRDRLISRIEQFCFRTVGLRDR